MSSIFKYVADVARQNNPRVQVSMRGSRIVGTINGEEVFNIADRYGYLDDSEKSAIRSGVQNYEHTVRMREEAERRERERREAERKAEYGKARQAVTDAKSRLTQSYNSAKTTARLAAERANMSGELKALEGFKTGSFDARAYELAREFGSCISRIDAEYGSKNSEIDSISLTINSSGTTESFRYAQNSLRNVSSNVFGGKLPVAKANDLRGEIRAVAAALTELKKLKRKLTDISASDALVAETVKNAISAIDNTEITCVEDVNKIVDNTLDAINSASDLLERSKTKESVATVAALAGAARACTEIRAFEPKADYEKHNYESEVAEAASQVYDTFGKLASAEYTTCSDEALKSALSAAGRAMSGAECDETTLEMLEKLNEQGLKYASDDKLLKSEYDKYKELTDELLENGCDLGDDAKFDAAEPDEQLRRLNARLTDIDIEMAQSRTASTFAVADQAMGKMGYKRLYTEMADNGMGFHAVYVIPGCDGAVWDVVSSGDNVMRKLVGVRRPNGRTTDEESVFEMAQKLDREHEGQRFIAEYAEACGSTVVTRDDFADTVYQPQNAREQIHKNGVFDLTEKGEPAFDALVGEVHEETKSVQKAGAEVVTTERAFEEESRNCELRVRAKRT